jgi:hyperosmotically inducible periplasmic protein
MVLLFKSVDEGVVMRLKRMLSRLVLPVGLTLAAGHTLVWAETTQSPPSASSYDADNTGRNVRDRDDAALTPENQLENESDREITAAIRRAIVKDDSLSTNAHNVKIMTRDQVVTLRGPVDSPAEKTKLDELAREVQGVKQIDNQLEVNVR